MLTHESLVISSHGSTKAFRKMIIKISSGTPKNTDGPVHSSSVVVSNSTRSAFGRKLATADSFSLSSVGLRASFLGCCGNQDYKKGIFLRFRCGNTAEEDAVARLEEELEGTMEQK
jgi:hypothetical protein